MELFPLKKYSSSIVHIKAQKISVRFIRCMTKIEIKNYSGRGWCGWQEQRGRTSKDWFKQGSSFTGTSMGRTKDVGTIAEIGNSSSMILLFLCYILGPQKATRFSIFNFIWYLFWNVCHLAYNEKIIVLEQKKAPSSLSCILLISNP